MNTRQAEAGYQPQLQRQRTCGAAAASSTSAAAVARTLRAAIGCRHGDPSLE